MNKRFTAEQRQFVIDYPDFPSWVIADSFKEKFGRSISTRYINQIRLNFMDASNKRYGRGSRAFGGIEGVKSASRAERAEFESEAFYPWRLY